MSAQEWGPQARVRKPAKSSQRVGMSDDVRVAIQTGDGCWWQGDNWVDSIGCCDCGDGCSHEWLDQCCHWKQDWSHLCCKCNPILAQGP